MYNKVMKEDTLNKSLIQKKHVLDNTSIDIKPANEIASVKNLSAKMVCNTKAATTKSPEQEIAETLRKALTGKDADKKFEIVSKLFSKLINIDIRYGCILKEIKNVYDEKIEALTAKSPLNEKTNPELTIKTDQLEKKLRTPIKTPTRNTRNNVSMKLTKDSSFSKKAPCSTSAIKSNKRHIIIPRLDLSKIKPYTDNEVIYKKRSELISLNSYSEDYEKNPIAKYNMKIYGNKYH